MDLSQACKRGVCLTILETTFQFSDTERGVSQPDVTCSLVKLLTNHKPTPQETHLKLITFISVNTVVSRRSRSHLTEFVRTENRGETNFFRFIF